MIKLENVSKVFGDIKAVDSVSLEVASGETVVLLGTSGCGKTTTLRMINRLAEPSSGQILVGGKDILQQPVEALRRSIGYVLQHHGLFPHYTVAENIAIVPKLLGWPKNKISERVTVLLEKLQLPARMGIQFPAQLSGGQQQRVGLARALAADPPVLLMDEPLGALDPVTRADIRREFATLDELKKKTILMVTHDVQEAFELGDRICLMHKGKIVQIGRATELLFNPVNDFVSNFIKEQRFQLELESLTMVDIWGFLPLNINEAEKKAIKPEENIWTVLELLSKSPMQLVCNLYNETRQINMANLLTAYEQYKIHCRK